jgi:monoamine oxidase
MPRIRRPVEQLNVFLCGEAYSSSQGWVEGAVNTAEMVVEDYFDLPRPDWVLPEYDFGP